MRILFVSVNMMLGGVETLILRMSRYLKEHDHSVTVLLFRPGTKSLVEELSTFAEVKIWRSEWTYWGISRWVSHANYDVIYCFNLRGLLRGMRLHAICPSNVRLAMGVYHPREYCWQSKWRRYRQELVLDVVNTVPLENIFFMNVGSAREMGQCVGRDFTASPTIPIPVDCSQYALCPRRRVNKNKIVSIGRIVDFKTYNWHMVDTIASLNAKGYGFEYHIYGTGPLFQDLKSYIDNSTIADKVYLHGELAYTDFCRVLEDAFLFVGVGTSLVESAACGVPSLMAIDSCGAPLTYGMFHEVGGYKSGFNMGEYDPGLEPRPLANEIERIYQLSEEEYRNVSLQSRQRASEFSIDRVMKLFLGHLMQLSEFNYRMSRVMRFRDFMDVWAWRVLRRLGFEDPFTDRFMRRPYPPRTAQGERDKSTC